MRWCSTILLFFILPSISAQISRIESEYKLGLPNEQAESLWSYLQSDNFLNELNSNQDLKTETSIEEFYDTYFDDKNYSLYNQSLGLRHRSRYVKDTLLKKLIQIKTPISEDGVARNEFKYEVRKTIGKNDLMSRHPFYTLVKKMNRQDIKYQLSKFGVDDLSLKPSVKLKQIRKRIYISDAKGAIATATLDEVKQQSFPFLKFTEMELELNEIRYTDATPEEQLKMEALNEKMKNVLNENFPSLQQDQTPKYNKMKTQIDNNVFAIVYKNRMWIILISLVCWATYLWKTRV